jgi:hypothetical protein
MLKRKLKEPFGKAGLTVAVLALVMAMVGGAFAANHAATASKAGKQGKQGKPGKTGPAGPAGATGAAGPAGPAGPKGAAGEAGEKGEKGEKGETGSPWTAGGTLPSKATETGAWFAEAEHKPVGAGLITAISFPIRLSAALNQQHVFFLNPPGFCALLVSGSPRQQQCETRQTEEETVRASDCTGSAEQPTAAPGDLCVYAAELGAGDGEFPSIEEPPITRAGVAGGQPASSRFGAGTTGADLTLTINTTEETTARGTWAVTAP